ncbi:MAG: hypothetical protein D6734_11980, partial [Candidatus Schekmanbacteria bacterium]
MRRGIIEGIDKFLENKNSFTEKEKAKKKIISLYKNFEIEEEEEEDFISIINEITNTADPDLTLNS